MTEQATAPGVNSPSGQPEGHEATDIGWNRERVRRELSLLWPSSRIREPEHDSAEHDGHEQPGDAERHPGALDTAVAADVAMPSVLDVAKPPGMNLPVADVLDVAKPSAPGTPENRAPDVAKPFDPHQVTNSVAVLPADAGRRVSTTLPIGRRVGVPGLDRLLGDPDIDDINLNGDQLFVCYADGRRERRRSVVGSDEELVQLVRDLADHSGVARPFDRGGAGVDFQLPGGEQVFAVMGVAAQPSVSIRCRRHRPASLAGLRRLGTIDREVESFLSAAVWARKNILVTGHAAVGKATLLRALMAEIPPWERLVTVEDAFELGLDRDTKAHPDAVALRVCGTAGGGRDGVSRAELLRWAMRMWPDRVLVGGVRESELIPLCDAMGQGRGSMATLMAGTSLTALTRLAEYGTRGPELLSLEAAHLLIASAVDFVVHLERPSGESRRRVVSSVREVVGSDGPHIVSNEVFRPGPGFRAVPSASLRAETLGDLVTVGYRPGDHVGRH